LQLWLTVIFIAAVIDSDIYFYTLNNPLLCDDSFPPPPT